MAWMMMVAFGKGQKWTDFVDTLEADFMELDKRVVPRNEEKDGLNLISGF